MNTSSLRSILVAFALVAPGTLLLQEERPAKPVQEPQEADEEKAVRIRFLEIVTDDVDETCRALAKLHGVEFAEPDPALGNGRTAPLASGGRISVRAPMHAGEKPVVRPYILVDDVETAVKAAHEQGGEIAVPAMEIPEHGTIAIYFQGGIEYGLWKD